MNHYSLHDFHLLIKQTLSEQLERSYWIIAEIGQINRHSAGHCYLELVEKDQQYVKAKARATIWANTYRDIHPWFVSQTGTELKQGMKILFNASLEFHEVYGMNLSIKDIDVNFTLGERERKKQETLRQLEQDGILDMNKSLELPTVIQNLAIISAESAAGYEDFVTQLQNNPYHYHTRRVLFPATMQGDAAPASIINSLHQIFAAEEHFDAVVLIRGGGSKMDLDCFDEYELCAHLAQFPLPLLTGIGHERDQSIADRVAHTSLKTPTAVAEFVLTRMLTFESTVHDSLSIISSKVQALLQKQWEKVNELKYHCKMSTRQLLQQNNHALEKIQHTLTTQPAQILRMQRADLMAKAKLAEAYDPIKLLNKGYSITRINGQLLRHQTVQVGDVLETQTADINIKSTINKIS